ncbi:MAG TPA: hypothetical protein VI277_08615 [Candidatus Limnocylindria bacterium]
MVQDPLQALDAGDRPGGRRRLLRTRMLQGAAFAAGFAVLLLAPGAITRLTEDPYQRAAAETGRELLNLPGFEERYGDVDEEDAFDVGAQLGLAAIPRLPDAELVEYLALTRQLLTGLEAAACADILRGTADAEELTEAFRTLDLDAFRRYLELVTHGAALVLSGPPAPEPEPGDVDEAIQQLSAELGTARMADIAGSFLDPATTDADLCAAAHDLYMALEAVGPATARPLLRDLVAPPPST